MQAESTENSGIRELGVRRNAQSFRIGIQTIERTPLMTSHFVRTWLTALPHAIDCLATVGALGSTSHRLGSSCGGGEAALHTAQALSDRPGQAL
jgi:hypothetical protein